LVNVEWGGMGSTRELPFVGVASVRFSSLRSPLGQIFFVMSGRGLCNVTIGARRHAEYRRYMERHSTEVWRDDEGLRDVYDEFVAYLSGHSQTFVVPTDLRGVTPFVGQVLRKVQTVTFGAVTSYGSVARQLGHPRAGRAVGTALGRNPVPIVIPCHRVLRSTGEVGGYAFGSKVKRALLGIEGYRTR